MGITIFWQFHVSFGSLNSQMIFLLSLPMMPSRYSLLMKLKTKDFYNLGSSFTQLVFSSWRLQIMLNYDLPIMDGSNVQYFGQTLFW